MTQKSTKIPVNQAEKHSLAISDLRIRLEFLERENQKLLGKIEKKQTELKNSIDLIGKIALEVAQRSAPVLQQLLELDLKLHAVFADIFTGRKLGKQTRKKIETIYTNLQASGLISPARLQADRQRSSNPDPTEEADRHAHESDWAWGDRQSASMFEDDLPGLDRDELKKIRQLFLRLAEVFHPDKLADEKLKQYHTEVMQEINQAYQSGDLARLLAIEKKHQMGQTIDPNNQNELTQRCIRIEQENEFLTNQFEQIKLELRLTKNTQQGALAAEYRKLSKAGYDPIGEIVAQTESQVTTILAIYQFTLDFRDRRIAIKDFIKGPAIFQEMSQMSEEDLFIEFLGL
jgi:hypothetical protein